MFTRRSFIAYLSALGLQHALPQESQTMTPRVRSHNCGQMSAWYVLSAFGFYSVDPVSGTYVFGTPLFDHAVVDLGSVSI
jgi:putative alpha-1,2-mannosidase